MNIIQVSVDLIKPPKNSVRLELGDIDELADSINRKGLLNPLTIRPLEGGYEIIAGHRRFEALKKLGWSEIPCQVVEASDKDAYEASLVENVQRKTLNPIEEAEAYQRYLVIHRSGTHRQLSKAVGKDERYVSDVLKRLEIPDEARKRLVSTRVSKTTIDETAPLKPEERAEVLEKAIDNNLTMRDIRQVTKRVKAGKPVQEAVDEVKEERLKKSVDKVLPSVKRSLEKVAEYGNSSAFKLNQTISIFEFIEKKIQDKAIYCPDHKDATLVWSCCGKSVPATIGFLKGMVEKESGKIAESKQV